MDRQLQRTLYTALLALPLMLVTLGGVTLPQPAEAAWAPLTDEQAAELAFLREEEKGARDVYNLFTELGYYIPFEGIAQAEQRHMDSVLTLLEQYGVTDPALAAAGEFSDPLIQSVYNDLIAWAGDSPFTMLEVGAFIEDADLAHVSSLMTQFSQQQDVLLVLDHLARGSRNHLRTFVWLLEAQGYEYVPQFLDPALFQEVISTPYESGP